jgi:hypothetical protein
MMYLVAVWIHRLRIIILSHAAFLWACLIRSTLIMHTIRLLKHHVQQSFLSGGGTMTLPKTFVVSRRTIVAIEQWFCLLLGMVCMASGTWGICMRRGEYPLPAWIAWLGSAYVPALRVTAVVCLGMGIALVRLGSGKKLPASESPYLKLTVKPGSPEASHETGEGSQVAHNWGAPPNQIQKGQNRLSIAGERRR